MLTIVTLGTVAMMTALQSNPLQVWKLDPLEAVFRDTKPVETRVDPIDVAKGEVAEWQIIVRSEKPIESLSLSLGPLKTANGEVLGKPKSRFIGQVTLTKPPTWVSTTQLNKIPGDFPDPLLTDKQISVKANESQSMWVDLAIAKDAKPGLYQGTVTVKAVIEGKTTTMKVPIEAKVYDVFVGKNRLWATNWFFAWPQYMTVKQRKGETQEEAQLRMFAESLSAHRLNVGLVPTFRLIKYGLDKKGNMTADFSEFDKRVRLMIKCGLGGMIEGDGMGTREGWAKPNLGIIYVIENGKAVQKILPAADPAVEKFYAFIFPKLLEHLKKRGWDKIYVQHVIDEPCDDNVDSYKVLSDLVVKYLPGIRRIDTCCGTKFEGLNDIYSPELDFLHENYDLFKKYQKAGKELWYYTCWKPQGEYANRLIEEPLMKTRLLHWIHFKYEITGFLHWGYDYWAYNEAFKSKKDQFTHDYSPGGDGWITYPGKGEILDSRRNESMRDSMADHELLSMLADKNKAKARAIADKLILAMDKYVLDIDKFRAARRELLDSF